jgi:hypothetical protein
VSIQRDLSTQKTLVIHFEGTLAAVKISKQNENIGRSDYKFSIPSKNKDPIVFLIQMR